MFGYAAFAQPTFAGLGGNSYTFTLTENVGVADSNTQAWTFLQTITEPITVGNVDSEAGLFFGSIVENFGVADSSTCLLYTSPSPRDRTRSRMPSSA